MKFWNTAQKWQKVWWLTYLISDVYETIAVDSYQGKIPSEVLKCYKFSKYVVDPNKARFKKVVRIFVFVLRLIKNLQKSKSCQPSIAQKTSYPGILSDEEISWYWKLLPQEGNFRSQRICQRKGYQKISFQKDGILYYKGRMLETEKINATCEMSTVMKDLC